MQNIDCINPRFCPCNLLVGGHVAFWIKRKIEAYKILDLFNYEFFWGPIILNIKYPCI